MLALFRPRYQLHSLQFQYLRTLRTLPRIIPKYIKRWDPTLHKTNDLRPPATKLTSAYKAELNEAAQEEGLGAKGKYAGGSHPVERLYRLLHLATQKPGKVNPENLWELYTLAKAADRNLLTQISDSQWDALWTVLYTKSPTNDDEKARLAQLYRDLHAAGKDMSSKEEIKYLENLFLSGKEVEALQIWEKAVISIDKEKKLEYLELGAKLYALAGNVDRSQAILNALHSLLPDGSASVMMVVFRALTSSKLQRHHKAAEEIYLMMKSRNANAMTFEDYTSWFIGFLEARHLQYAKQVFQDMIEDGRLPASGDADRVKEVLKRLYMLYRLGTDISNMTSIVLDVMVVLPQEYHRHLFGHWMQAAVVHQAPEAAAQILDLMFQRGLKPETFHFNTLLKALIRSQEAPNILRAEDIGWRMIEKARKAYKRSLVPDDTAEIINKRSKRPRPLDTKVPLDVPVANAETFALLMQHHAKRLQWEHIDYLSRQLKAAAVNPNETIMNVLMDNKCRQGAYSEAWSIYKTLTNPPEGSEGVFPNGASFRCLWKMLRLALGDHVTRKDPNLPTPRELLEEFVSWWALSRSRFDAQRFKIGLAAADGGAISALIMHCFSYTQDLAGSLVALHVLRQHFNIYPTDKTLSILQRQMAWIDMARESENVRTQFFRGGSNRKNLATIQNIYEILRKRRINRMKLYPEVIVNFNEEQIGDIALNLMSEFIRVILKRVYPPEVVEAMVHTAKVVVGVPTLTTGDRDAFEVA